MIENTIIEIDPLRSMGLRNRVWSCGRPTTNNQDDKSQDHQLSVFCILLHIINCTAHSQVGVAEQHLGNCLLVSGRSAVAEWILCGCWARQRHLVAVKGEVTPVMYYQTLSLLCGHRIQWTMHSVSRTNHFCCCCCGRRRWRWWSTLSAHWLLSLVTVAVAVIKAVLINCGPSG